MFEDIKRLHYHLVLKDLGIEYKDYGKYAVGKASYRNDNNPSLTVFFDDKNNIWRWKDHATNETGTWIDLYLKHGYNFSQALKRLYDLQRNNVNFNNFNPNPNLITVKVDKVMDKEMDKVEMDKVEIIEWDTRAKEFIYRTRKYKELPEFLHKIKVNGKYEYYGIKDVMGNWHVRSFSTVNQIKKVIRQNPVMGSYYSLFLNKKENKSKGIAVCEGLHDAIALWTLFNDYDILCLNSTANLTKALDELNTYEKIIISTDNDETGRKAKNIIVATQSNKNIYEVRFNSKDIDEAFRKNEKVTVVNIRENGLTADL